MAGFSVGVTCGFCCTLAFGNGFGNGSALDDPERRPRVLDFRNALVETDRLG
jgi:hypothetical protein